MNGWLESATVAARDRMNDYRRQADDARALRLAREHGAVAERGWVLARRRAANALHALADVVAPRTIQGSDALRRSREAGGRPIA